MPSIFNNPFSTPDFNQGNFKAATEADAAASQAAQDRRTLANRPNQKTPFGDINWTQTMVRDPATGKMVPQWTQTQTLPESQADALRKQQGITDQRAGAAAAPGGRLEGDFANRIDYSGFTDIPDIEAFPELRQRSEDASYGRSVSRLDPQYQERDEQIQIQLRNKGLRPGTDAYNREYDAFTRDRSDAYERARFGATQEGRVEAAQTYDQQYRTQAQAAKLRDRDINEAENQRTEGVRDINALIRPGDEVGLPKMPSFDNASTAGSPDYFGALDASQGEQRTIYNAALAGDQALMTSLGKLGSGALEMYTDWKSDNPGGNPVDWVTQFFGGDGSTPGDATAPAGGDFASDFFGGDGDGGGGTPSLPPGASQAAKAAYNAMYGGGAAGGIPSTVVGGGGQFGAGPSGMFGPGGAAGAPAGSGGFMAGPGGAALGAGAAAAFIGGTRMLQLKGINARKAAGNKALQSIANSEQVRGVVPVKDIKAELERGGEGGYSKADWKSAMKKGMIPFDAGKAGTLYALPGLPSEVGKNTGAIARVYKPGVGFGMLTLEGFTSMEDLQNESSALRREKLLDRGADDEVPEDIQSARLR